MPGYEIAFYGFGIALLLAGFWCLYLEIKG